MPWYIGCLRSLFRSGQVVRAHFPIFVADVYDAFAGKDLPIASIARHHTVKHIYSEADVFQDICRCSHTHEIPRFVFWQDGTCTCSMFVHFFSGFTNTKASNGITVRIFTCDIFCRFISEVFVGRALDDRE